MRERRRGNGWAPTNAARAEALRTTRRSVGYARDFFAEALPDGDERAMVLNRLARSVALAAEERPAAWCLVYRPHGFLRLTTGMIEVLTVARDGAVNVFFDQNEIDAEGRAALEDAGPGWEYRRVTFRTVERVARPGIVTLRAGDIAEGLALTGAAHETLVRVGARSRAGISVTWQRAHSPGFIDYLAQATGWHVPQPAYWPV